MLSRLILFLILTIPTFLLVPSVLAAPASSPFTFSQPPNFAITDIGTFITSTARLAIIIGSILIFVFLIWGGFQWLTSGGDSAKTKEARDKITSAIIGFSILALAVAITLLVEFFFDITIIGVQTLPTGY